MSERKEYWQEIFGDDFNDDLVDELGFSKLMDSSADEGGETFPVDESLFAPENTHAPRYESTGDATNVIPPQVTDLSAYTGGNRDPGAAEDIGFSFDPFIGPDAYAAEEEQDYAPEYSEEYDEDAEYDDEYDEEYDPDDPEYEDEDDEYDEREEQRAIRITRKKRTGLLGGFMYAVFILGAGVILASLAWMFVDDVLGLTKDETLVEVTIPENFTIEEVAEILYAQGLINYRFLFIRFAELFNAYDRIQPGIYQVPMVDYRAIIGSLNQRTGARIEVTMTIPEGRTMLEVFHILQANGVATVESLQYAAENGTFNFSFLEDIPLNAMNRLEGYLFPDTYTFFKHQDPEQVIRTMLRNFETRMQQNYVFDLVEESAFTLHEIVNIASMIEKEIANRDEGPIISSVIHNRLNRDMILQIDATIQYILGEDRREVLRREDLEIQSPYNTYIHTGLPYGPIGNPGVASILAALQPASTNYIFYALHRDGHHAFFVNYDQHRAFQNTPNFAHYGRF